MGKKTKARVTLKPEQVRQILALEVPPIPERGQFYKELAEQYNCSVSIVRNIKSKTKNATTESYMRLSLKKVVTKKQAINIIKDIYKDYYKEEPTEVRFVDRYGVCQIYILPAKIIIQMDELLLCDLQRFVQAVDRHIRDYYKNNPPVNDNKI